MIGGAAAVPLAAVRYWTWSKDAAQLLPAADNMHEQFMKRYGSWLQGLEPQHVAFFVIAETLSITLLLLPAAQGALTLTFDMYGEVSKQAAFPIRQLFLSLFVLGVSFPTAPDLLPYSCRGHYT